MSTMSTGAYPGLYSQQILISIFFISTIDDPPFTRHSAWAARPLELRFNRPRDFIVADEAGDALDLLAIPVDQHAGGITEQPAELVRRLFVADHDRIVHLRF